MRQMSGGGTVMAFTVKDGKEARSASAMRLRSSRFPTISATAKSIVTHPATTTHFRLGPEARAEAGINDGMLRLSCGLEDPEDLIDDLAAALAKV